MAYISDILNKEVIIEIMDKHTIVSYKDELYEKNKKYQEAILQSRRAKDLVVIVEKENEISGYLKYINNLINTLKSDVLLNNKLRFIIYTYISIDYIPLDVKIMTLAKIYAENSIVVDAEGFMVQPLGDEDYTHPIEDIDIIEFDYTEDVDEDLIEIKDDMPQHPARYFDMNQYLLDFDSYKEVPVIMYENVLDACTLYNEYFGTDITPEDLYMDNLHKFLSHYKETCFRYNRKDAIHLLNDLVSDTFVYIHHHFCIDGYIFTGKEGLTSRKFRDTIKEIE